MIRNSIQRQGRRGRLRPCQAWGRTNAGPTSRPAC